MIAIAAGQQKGAPLILKCDVVGAETLETGKDDRDVCERFAEGLTESLDRQVMVPQHGSAEEWHIHARITISSGGGIMLDAEYHTEDGHMDKANLGLNVADRALEIDDIVQLGGFLGKTILSENS